MHQETYRIPTATKGLIMSEIQAQVLASTEEHIRPETLQLGAPKAGEVRVDIAACGVCHTDLHVIKGEVNFPRPAVLGHEVSGVVVDVGEDVEHVRPADRVVAAFIMPCGSCRHCAAGLEELCEVFFTRNRLNGTLLDGTTRVHRSDGTDVAMYSMAGHASQAIIPASAVFWLPDEISLQDAAILGCSMFTSYGSVVQVGRVAHGETVAVVAAGGIGLAITHLAAAAGASRIFVIDLDDAKLDLARELGATDVINSSQEDPLNVITTALGHGVDVVFEALGTQHTVGQAVSLVDDGGRVVLTGIAPPGHVLDTAIAHVVRRKVQILGSYGAKISTAMPAVIELAAQGKIELGTLITDRFSFDQTDRAYLALNDRKIRGRGVIEINPALQ
ncbi:zinc-binding dehydrogenase [Yaniella halotolerans]|uniref:zinc-binding dehydrogenase n=1 Tax=Yaniella halotolerans TaxID=225453 RepID=UPI001B7FDCDF|nr:zinc-binding dehydrogenase [Yaniella halotolerans]